MWYPGVSRNLKVDSDFWAHLCKSKLDQPRFLSQQNVSHYQAEEYITFIPETSIVIIVVLNLSGQDVWRVSKSLPGIVRLPDSTAAKHLRSTILYMIYVRGFVDINWNYKMSFSFYMVFFYKHHTSHLPEIYPWYCNDRHKRLRIVFSHKKWVMKFPSKLCLLVD